MDYFQLQQQIGLQAPLPNIYGQIPAPMSGYNQLLQGIPGGIVPFVMQQASLISQGTALQIAQIMSANNFTAQNSLTLIQAIIQSQNAALNLLNAIKMLNQNQQAIALQLQLMIKLLNDTIYKQLVDANTLQQAQEPIVQLQFQQQFQQQMQFEAATQTPPLVNIAQVVPPNPQGGNVNSQNSGNSTEKMSGLSEQ
ncbi:hypothetical protein OXYTRIMIC_339 [Oxytricha trifallax]|uniref:Uncharacterized protein n=1 Tax=Oxytricha trifallax TaxID=1172189 RepID=A0A073I084_9SPIT|nr:hypothetical protein OXYTRIMIC_339 [Oxytricha trifallax]